MRKLLQNASLLQNAAEHRGVQCNRTAPTQEVLRIFLNYSGELPWGNHCWPREPHDVAPTIRSSEQTLCDHLLRLKS